MPFRTQQFEPDSALGQHVKCMWTFEQNQAEHNQVVLLPDTNIELLFNCGAPNVMTAAGGGQIELPPVLLNGLQKQPTRPKVTGDCQFIAVRFNVWAMRHFIDLPNHIDSDDLRMIALDSLWQDFGRVVREAVEHYGYAEAAARIQQFLLDIQRPHPAARSIRIASETLHNAHGQVAIHELIGDSHLSPRQFERQFKYFTGMLPKSYARLVRHEAVRGSLLSDPNRSLVTLAQDFGYTDQAHFSHDFKTFTSYTPGQYATALQSVRQQ
ncbi:MAG: helix-turn-helix domain-containing protein [Chloroflexota bacterium]